MFGDEHMRDDAIWGHRWDWGEPPLPVPVEARPAEAREQALPDWLHRPVAPEPRPPRPLAPSSLGEDTSADPPFAPGAGVEAARRGVLVHKLLERLPDVPADNREPAALAWLARNAAELPEESRAELARSALAVIASGQWADIFAPGALAEVPIAAVVGDLVVAGTIDRLLIEPDRIRLVDFKTARRPPERLEQVPVAILRQMAAYAAALERVYPGRSIEVALLYTAAPRLIEIPGEVLDMHKQSLLAPQ
jgi:ATP-dependent helicase/nuclease subunit A